MKCVFCGEQDASNLAIIVKAVEGRIIYDREACLDCLWKSRFAVRTLEENGKILSEGKTVGKGVFAESNPSAAGMDPNY